MYGFICLNPSDTKFLIIEIFLYASCVCIWLQSSPSKSLYFVFRYFANLLMQLSLPTIAQNSGTCSFNSNYAFRLRVFALLISIHAEC